MTNVFYSMLIIEKTATLSTSEQLFKMIKLIINGVNSAKEIVIYEI
jgi:hypothetical protein